MTLLRHTLFPLFAVVFGIGVQQLYKVFDKVFQLWSKGESIFGPEFLVPFAMILMTLHIAALSLIANVKLTEKNPEATAFSTPAFLAYASATSLIIMAYFSVSLAFVYWWLGSYAVLCVVNAVWNFVAIESPQANCHVWTNAMLSLVIITALIILLNVRFTEGIAFVSFVFLFVMWMGAKLWQRRQPRFEHIRDLSVKRQE
jgi:hypothetical protein